MSDPAEMSNLTLDVTVNGKARTVPAFGTLADLVGELGHASESMATALNGQFVARGQRHEHVLRDGDRVTCFQAIVGG
jgi:sulfur carrier protein